MWQWVLVASFVVASAAYAAWAVMTPALRQRFAGWLVRHGERGPAALRRLAGRLEQAALPRGGCESCPASRVAPTSPAGRRRR